MEREAGGDDGSGRAGQVGAVMGLFHAGVTVRDMDASLRFYRDALGLELVSRIRGGGRAAWAVLGLEAEAVQVAFLRIPGTAAQIELFEFEGVERHGASARPCDFGAGHFCLYVDDAEAVLDRVRGLGYSSRSDVVRFGGEPFGGARAVYLLDPDGYHVELFQPPSGALRKKTTYR